MLRAYVLTVAAISIGCGARSDLDAPGGASGGGAGEGGQLPCAGATCSDITRGTFRLFDEGGVDLGFLFLFDATGICNGAPTHYLLVLEQGEDDCQRNSDIVASVAGPDRLIATADNHGGTPTPRCGGRPFDESMTISLVRDECDGDTYALSIDSSEPGSIFTLEAVARRCRCDIAWQACAAPLPEDPCAS